MEDGERNTGGRLQIAACRQKAEAETELSQPRGLIAPFDCAQRERWSSPPALEELLRRAGAQGVLLSFWCEEFIRQV